jgi:hypothetical protein
LCQISPAVQQATVTACTINLLKGFIMTTTTLNTEARDNLELSGAGALTFMQRLDDLIDPWEWQGSGDHGVLLLFINGANSGVRLSLRTSGCYSISVPYLFNEA